LAEQRIYEVVFIVDPDTGEDDVTRLSENLQQTIADQGGTVTKAENMGRRQLAYRIGRKAEGVYMLFEIEGSGREIAELERRMRVSDQVIRYITVRVDEDRRRAEKFKARRARKASKRSATPSVPAGRSTAAAPARNISEGHDEA
jgi:small subunit ribosomal protein S6